MPHLIHFSTVPSYQLPGKNYNSISVFGAEKSQLDQAHIFQHNFNISASNSVSL